MCVLIEALTLVVRKLSLEIAYPGGSDAFLHATLELAQPPRFVCSCDPELVNLSFYSPEHAEPCIELLLEHGFIELEDESTGFVDFALLDQHFGPALHCSWLEWKRHPEGFSYAWLAGTEPGDMAVPEDWTPERSRTMQRHDIRDDPGMLRLQRKDGREVWLDLRTGREWVGLSHPRQLDGPPDTTP